MYVNYSDINATFICILLICYKYYKGVSTSFKSISVEDEILDQIIRWINSSRHANLVHAIMIYKEGYQYIMT